MIKMMSNSAYVKAVAEELETKGAYAYFEAEDIFDIEYSIDDQLNYRGVRIMIACGGPTVYIDSKTGSVDLFWGSEEAHYYLSPSCRDDINGYFSERFQMESSFF